MNQILTIEAALNLGKPQKHEKQLRGLQDADLLFMFPSLGEYPNLSDEKVESLKILELYSRIVDVSSRSEFILDEYRSITFEELIDYIFFESTSDDSIDSLLHDIQGYNMEIISYMAKYQDAKLAQKILSNGYFE